MGVIAKILRLFGCSRKRDRGDDGASAELLQQIEQSLEAFRNRPIHKELTSRIVDLVPDDDLLQVVFDNLCANMPDDYTKEYDTVMNWNKSRQAVYMIWLLEMDVHNGGHNQFYFNPSGQFYRHLPDALKLIGANKHADLMQRANETFEKDNITITRHQDGTLEGFCKSYENNPLNDFDDEFYEADNEEDLTRAMTDFIKRNKHDFINK
jgi:hypothetical protein